MRVAIFSDVHGNVAALEAVLADIRARGPFDRILNGGDFAFGGPRPREAVERLIEGGYPAVVGNTDEMVAASPEGAAGAVAAWARTRLTPEQVDWLRALPRSRRVDAPGGPPLVLVHATPWSTTDLIEPSSPAATVARAFEQAEARTLVYGHIHRAYIREVAGGLIVNAGSVGFPFDGIPRPAWAILTLERGAWRAEIVRIEYDREAVIQDLLTSDHPDAQSFVRRIRSGRL
ncbi:MAG TPA: metallophosphoesterase family protein [bacterium]|nr:metallophosphoesterase family protein [bacterium]